MSSSPVTIGCIVLIVSFFLPWISILGAGVGGYEIHQLSSHWMWLWSIPVAGVAALVLGFAGKRNIEVAQIAGGLPLVGLAVALYQNGLDLIRALQIGAWATLGSGLFLLCIAPRLRRKAAAQPPGLGPSGDNR